MIKRLSHCAVLTLSPLGFCFSGYAAAAMQADSSALDNNQTTATNPMTITADLTDAPRKLLHAEIEIPVKPGRFTFTAAKWIPGSHSPTGPSLTLPAFW